MPGLAEESEDRRRAAPILRVARNSPFLMISLAVHALALLLLGYVTSREVEKPLPPMELTMEEAIVMPQELTVLRREPRVFGTGGSSSSGTGAGAGEGFESAVQGTELANVGKLDPLGLRALRQGSAGDFEGLAGAKFEIAPGKGERSIGGAMDQFAISTLNAMEDGKTLVVLLIDQSRSIVYGDLPRLVERMDSYFAEVEKNLTEDVRDRGRWVVVAYGRDYRYICEPSAELDQVKNALRDVQVDTSGVENVGAAVLASLDKYGNSGYKHILIAALTDEAGDDIEDPAVLETVIRALRAKRAHFYVFGYESVFAARLKHIRFKLDPGLVRGSDRVAIRGFEGRVIDGWADGGPESPLPELWWGTNWYNWRAWGGSISNIPSGFGMYGLNRIVLATDGLYFLLRSESRYDEQKLYGQYRPDICTIPEYGGRMDSSPLRHELVRTWALMGDSYMPYDLRSNDVVIRGLKDSMEGREFCIAQASKLQKLLVETKPEGPNWKRWQAHTELTIAELLRLRFMLGQYRERLQYEWLSHGRMLPVDRRILMTRGIVPDDYLGPEQAGMEYELALQQINRIIEDHRGTPWETVALRMRNDLFPWRCAFAGLPSSSGPSPPGLEF